MAAFLLYRFITSCLRRPTGGNAGPGGGYFPGFGGFNNFFGRGDPPGYTPPPPYSSHKSTDPQQNNAGGGPGFWTGLGLGGLGGAALSRYFDGNSARPAQNFGRSYYDWERDLRPRPRHTDDRGEGSSRLGTLRSSTGYGRTNVR